MTYGGDRDPELVQMIARWVIAMPYVLKASVTEVKDLSAQLEVRLGHSAVNVGRHDHTPA